MAAVGSRVLSRALGLVFIVVLARESSTADFAAYSYLLILAATVGYLTDPIGTISARELARGAVGAGEAYRAGLPVVVRANALCALVVVVVGLLDRGPGTAGWPLLWTTLFIALNGLFNFQCELLRASGRPWVEAALQVLAAVTLVALGLIVVRAELGLAALMAVFALRQMLVVALAQAWLPVPWRAARRPGLAATLLRRGLLVAGAGVLLGVMLRFGGVALANCAGTVELADYSVAVRFLEASAIVFQTVGIGLLPALAQRAGRDARATHRLVTRMLAGGFALAVLASVPLILVTPALTTLVFGDRYESAGPVAQVFVGATPMLVVLFVAWFALVAERRERRVLIAMAGGALAVLPGCAWIVLSPGAGTAALATVLALGVACAGVVIAVSGRRREDQPAVSN